LVEVRVSTGTCRCRSRCTNRKCVTIESYGIVLAEIALRGVCRVPCAALELELKIRVHIVGENLCLRTADH
jgi:hypothetical protein